MGLFYRVLSFSKSGVWVCIEVALGVGTRISIGKRSLNFQIPDFIDLDLLLNIFFD